MLAPAAQSALHRAPTPPAQHCVTARMIALLASPARQTGAWTWLGGASSVGQAAQYLSLSLVGQIVGWPGSRAAHAFWGAGGSLWVFGGRGRALGAASGPLNDLWRYDAHGGGGGTWSLVGGENFTHALGKHYAQGKHSAANWPGSRALSPAAASAAPHGEGTLWLFGGEGYGSAAAPIAASVRAAEGHGTAKPDNVVSWASPQNLGSAQFLTRNNTNAESVRAFGVGPRLGEEDMCRLVLAGSGSDSSDLPQTRFIWCSAGRSRACSSPCARCRS